MAIHKNYGKTSSDFCFSAQQNANSIELSDETNEPTQKLAKMCTHHIDRLNNLHPALIMVVPLPGTQWYSIWWFLMFVHGMFAQQIAMCFERNFSNIQHNFGNEFDVVWFVYCVSHFIFIFCVSVCVCVVDRLYEHAFQSMNHNWK